MEPQLMQVGLLLNATVVVDNDGKIFAVDTEANLQQQDWYMNAVFEQTVDMRGKVLMPGLVDAHTHPVFAGDRVHEFEMKIAGATYMDIHKAGGGIQFTVEKTRQATEDQLLQLLMPRLDRMLKQGTTLVEAKSGYGLETETELKMLRVLTKANQLHQIAISPTFLGAHSVPKGSTSKDATRNVIEKQLPELLSQIKSGAVQCDNFDIFMERNVFEGDEAKQLLLAGKEAGLQLNFHGDELNYVGAAEYGVSIGSRAISHLEEISEDGIQAMAKSDCAAVLLPTTAHILRITPPPARLMIDRGIIVALGSDFNPNAHCLSMPFVMNLSCVIMRMTLAEVLNASTINAAYALNKSDLHGSIEKGKWANLIVVNHSDWRHVVYEMVDPPIQDVYVRGQLDLSREITKLFNRVQSHLAVLQECGGLSHDEQRVLSIYQST
ncbi:hypothetical protein MIR68_008470 [Amoeboaphelidium protococcarum]|nr:hypothetical protein MIR68_008470 [Amoeboaphelidium protococcarum]